MFHYFILDDFYATTRENSATAIVKSFVRYKRSTLFIAQVYNVDKYALTSSWLTIKDFTLWTGNAPIAAVRGLGDRSPWEPPQKIQIQGKFNNTDNNKNIFNFFLNFVGFLLKKLRSWNYFLKSWPTNPITSSSIALMSVRLVSNDTKSQSIMFFKSSKGNRNLTRNLHLRLLC